jgi:hypothetical protein
VKRNLFQEWDSVFVGIAKRVMDTGLPLVTPTYRESKGTIHQSYMVPVLDSRDPHLVKGVITGAVYYHEPRFRNFMEGLKLGAENFLLLTDVEGNVLARDGLDPSAAETDSLISSLQPQIQQASSAFYRTEGNRKPDEVWLERVYFKKDQAGYFLMALPVKPFNLLLTLGASDRPILHKKRILLDWMIASLAVIIVLSFFASGFVSSRLSRPFRLLIRAHERLQEGDLSARIDYGKGDEIGRLCDSFDKVAAKIEKARFLGNLWGKDSELTSTKPRE